MRNDCVINYKNDINNFSIQFLNFKDKYQVYKKNNNFVECDNYKM